MIGTAPHSPRRGLFAPETRLAFSPTTVYASLLAEPTVPLWQRLAITVLVMAVAIPIMAVQRLTFGLILVTAISWTFVLAIQLVMAALMIASVPSRAISLTRAFDLWFAGHVPYSLWLLAVAALTANMEFGSIDLVIALAVVPSVWTAVIVSAFCRVVLGTSRTGARWRAAIHFAAAWAIGLQYVAWSAGGWFQITGSIAGFLG
jgi:hypothetical protein